MKKFLVFSFLSAAMIAHASLSLGADVVCLAQEPITFNGQSVYPGIELDYVATSSFKVRVFDFYHPEVVLFETSTKADCPESDAPRFKGDNFALRINARTTPMQGVASFKVENRWYLSQLMGCDLIMPLCP